MTRGLITRVFEQVPSVKEEKRRLHGALFMAKKFEYFSEKTRCNEKGDFVQSPIIESCYTFCRLSRNDVTTVLNRSTVFNFRYNVCYSM